MKTQEKIRRKPVQPPAQPPPAWHDPEERLDRLHQPSVTLEEMQAQFQRMMSQQINVPAELPTRKMP